MLSFIVIAWLLLRLPFRRNSSGTEAGQREWEARYEERLANPDFASIEQQTGAELPSLYKSLFAPGSEWLAKEWMIYPGGLDQDDTIYDVINLVPAHPDALREHPSTNVPLLAFAEGDCEEYWLELGSEDPPVFSHSTGDYESDEAFVRICDHLSVFLNWTKEAM